MATDNKERYLKQIADELHQMNKVLDRMCQAPTFYREDQFTEYAKKQYKELISSIEDSQE